MTGAAPKTPGHVLVIDDDRSARLLLDRVLSRAGHTVVLAETAEQAISLISQGQSFDVLITDKNLPGMDGLDLVRMARKANPRLQTILMTGFPTPETRSAASELGVASYLTKPFGVNEVLETCERAIKVAQGGQ